MVELKNKDIKSMGKVNREKKLEELKLELVKSIAGSKKTGGSKTKQIKKMIARMLTFNKSENEELKNKHRVKKNT